MEYLSDEDYAIAEENGISQKRAYQRFYTLGWDKQRALTQSIDKVSRWALYREKCETLGISQDTFNSRINRGMNPEKASTMPKMPNGVSFKNKNSRLPKELVEIAKNNGICRATLEQRVYRFKWDVQRAITEPVDIRKRRKVLSLGSD